MANVVVPQGMVPGPAGYPYASKGPGLCDVGTNPREMLPAAWVEVKIEPALDVDGEPYLVTPDAYGRLLHCLWTFTRPTVGYGKRRQDYPGWQPDGVGDQEEVRVETDPGTFWVGGDAYVDFVGGTPGDVYVVSVEYDVPRGDVDPETAVDVYEPAFEFTLTSVFVVGGGWVDLPKTPRYHTGVQIVSAPVQVVNGLGAIPLGSAPLKRPAPLNLGRYQVGGSGAIQTVGAV